MIVDCLVSFDCVCVALQTYHLPPPQRSFLVPADPSGTCDVSWQLGVCVCCCHNLVHIFSIERNERLQLINITSLIAPFLAIGEVVVVTHVQLCDEGVIVLSLQSSISECPGYIMGVSVSGQMLTAEPVRVASRVTFFHLPKRLSVLLLGHDDGRVTLMHALSLGVLMELHPHVGCLTNVFSSSIMTSHSHGHSHAAQSKGIISPMTDAAAVVAVRLGPDPLHPAVLRVGVCVYCIHNRCCFMMKKSPLQHYYHHHLSLF